MQRRDLLKALLAGAAALAAGARGACGAAPPAPLPRRNFGSTGLVLPVLGLGGHHLGLAPDEKAARELVEAALEEGLTFFDNAESYHGGRSERWMGAALGARRKDVFLMTKTHSPTDRSADSASRHLEGSLKRLGTDWLDLWQLHSVQTPEDVDRAFGKGGAWESIARAREQRVARFVGVTGHARPEANLRALHWFDRGFRFDAMQLPVNPLDAGSPGFVRDVLPALAERGIAVLAMKTTASGNLLAEGLATPSECLRFALGLPISVAIVGMESAALLRENARTVRDSEPMGTDERARLVARLRAADPALEWYRKR